jgi:predicted  nucleic acid-binding Zn-ribbon protein
MIVQELVRRTNDYSRRLRQIEQRIGSMEDRINIAEEKHNERFKKVNEKMAMGEADIRNINDEVIKLKNNFERVTKHINQFARKRDLLEIEKMFELLSPIRQEFVTKEELEEELHAR